jgi:hypothetical protein
MEQVSRGFKGEYFYNGVLLILANPLHIVFEPPEEGLGRSIPKYPIAVTMAGVTPDLHTRNSQYNERALSTSEHARQGRASTVNFNKPGEPKMADWVVTRCGNYRYSIGSDGTVRVGTSLSAVLRPSYPVTSYHCHDSKVREAFHIITTASDSRRTGILLLAIHSMGFDRYIRQCYSWSIHRSSYSMECTPDRQGVLDEIIGLGTLQTSRISIHNPASSPYCLVGLFYALLYFEAPGLTSYMQLYFSVSESPCSSRRIW